MLCWQMKILLIIFEPLLDSVVTIISNSSLSSVLPVLARSPDEDIRDSCVRILGFLTALGLFRTHDSSSSLLKEETKKEGLEIFGLTEKNSFFWMTVASRSSLKIHNDVSIAASVLHFLFSFIVSIEMVRT